MTFSCFVKLPFLRAQNHGPRGTGLRSRPAPHTQLNILQSHRPAARPTSWAPSPVHIRQRPVPGLGTRPSSPMPSCPRPAVCSGGHASPLPHFAPSIKFMVRVQCASSTALDVAPLKLGPRGLSPGLVGSPLERGGHCQHLLAPSTVSVSAVPGPSPHLYSPHSVLQGHATLPVPRASALRLLSSKVLHS